MPRPVIKELDLPQYTDSLDEMVDYLNGLTYSAVKTKYNAKEQWQAISIRGYSEDITNILKPGVLGSSSDLSSLQYTYLYEKIECEPLKKILWQIPAEFERVRIMRLRAGTKISKHTDKVDKEIKSGNIIRIHIPLKTSKDVTMSLWKGKEETVHNLETGKYYYTDVSKPHAVNNNADFDRLHLVVDCYTNPKIENLINEHSN
tara:strand:+ start:6729 stop:7337 length:609 start_codon:yes stop_codon:yes gene_type:complete